MEIEIEENYAIVSTESENYLIEEKERTSEVAKYEIIDSDTVPDEKYHDQKPPYVKELKPNTMTENLRFILENHLSVDLEDEDLLEDSQGKKTRTPLIK